MCLINWQLRVFEPGGLRLLLSELALSVFNAGPVCSCADTCEPSARKSKSALRRPV